MAKPTYKRLIVQLKKKRDEMISSMKGDLHDLGDKTGGDVGDSAFKTGTGEVSSRIAEIGSKEISLIDITLQKIEKGTYGNCEICTKRINTARLEALPYTPHCVECQRKLEQDGEIGSPRKWREPEEPRSDDDGKSLGSRQSP